MTAMALPLFFAACANDELEVVSNEAALQDGRAAVENVTLNFGEGVESRLAYNPSNKSYVWDESDQIGACLMDEISADYGTYKYSGDAYWSQRFTWVDYIQTNYLFNRDADGNWTTEAKMLEGNYFFHAPYNKNMALRDAYTFGCADQTLANTTTAALLDAYTDNNAFIGYGRVMQGNEDGESVKVDMVPVFGATGFTLENVGTKDYKISKIVLRGNKVSTTATVNPTSANTKVANYYVGNNMGGFNVDNYLGISNAWAGGDYNNDGSFNGTAALKNVLVYGGSGRVEVKLAAGNALNSKKSINVIAMVAPAAVAADGDAVLDIHTDKGLIRNIQLYQKNLPSNNGLVQSGSNKAVNLVTDKALTALAAGDKVLVQFDNTALDVPSTMDIYGTDELAALIHWNAATSAPITANLQTNVTITKAMAQELANSQITGATINGNGWTVSVAADAPATALDAFTYSNVSRIYVNGTQNLAKANGATVIDVRGTLNVTGDRKDFGEIVNYGTLNIKNNVNGGAIYNYASMAVTAGKTILATATVTNGTYPYAGTIENAGTIKNLQNTYGTVNNTGIIGTAALAVDLNAEPSNNIGTINNNVEGQVYLNVNNGKVYANNKSTSRMYDNAGYIIITNLDEDGNILAATMGNIVEEVAEPTYTDVLDVRANMIWLSSTLKAKDADKDADGALDAVALKGENGWVNVVAKSANAQITGNLQYLTVRTLTIEDGTKIVLNKVKVATQEDYIVMYGGTDNNPYNYAMITINSNARLKSNNTSAGEIWANVVSGTEAANKLDNNSSTTDIDYSSYATIDAMPK
ncbi:MAG: hypothetical protein IJB96_11870 [Lachnospira sp.]|nr:hypothetical protein [Lachnospira sp.]